MPTSLALRPVQPTRLELLYGTDVAIGNTGIEERVPQSGSYPRQTFEYEFNMDDDDTRRYSLEQYNDITEDLVIPVWHEERLYETTKGRQFGQFMVVGISKYADPQFRRQFKVGDYVFVGPPDNLQLRQIERVPGRNALFFTAETSMLTPPVDADYISVIPGIVVQRHEDSEMNYFVINGATARFAAVSKEFPVLIPDEEKTFLDDLDGEILLDHRPLVPGTFIKLYNQQQQILDFEGRFQIDTDLQSSRVQKFLQFEFDYQDWPFWKTFLDAVQGRSKSFYTPTFLNDIQFRSFAAANRIITERVPETLGTQRTRRNVVIEFTNGFRQFLQVSNISQGLTNAVLDFTTAIGTGGLTIKSISMVELVRLASDLIVTEHTSMSGRIEMTVITVSENQPVTGDTGAFDSGFSDGFMI